MTNTLALCGVYLIRCIPTGDLYVGGTKISFVERFNWHLTALKRGTHHVLELQALFDLHGPGAFEFGALKAFPPEEVHRREREAIMRLSPSLNPRQTSVIDAGVDGVIDLTHLAEASGFSYATLKYRWDKGLRGEELTAARYRSKRREYTRKK